MIDARSIATNPHGFGPLNPLGIAVHHTVTQMSATASETDERTHLATINSYHLSEGFGGIGYHVVVFPSGHVYQVGDLDHARAHVKDRNDHLIGIACVGDFTITKPSALTLSGLDAALTAVDPGRLLAVKGHEDWAPTYDPTACPGSLLSYYDGAYPERASTPSDGPNAIDAAHALHVAYTGYVRNDPSLVSERDREALKQLSMWYDLQP